MCIRDRLSSAKKQKKLSDTLDGACPSGGHIQLLQRLLKGVSLPDCRGPSQGRPSSHPKRLAAIVALPAWIDSHVHNYSVTSEVYASPRAQPHPLESCDPCGPS